MNVANLLTTLRFLLIPVYIVMFFMGEHTVAFVVVVLSIATDVADGYIARKWNQTTYVGSMLDPLADKCMMIAIVLTFLIRGWIPWQAAAVIFFRDIGMILGSLIFHLQGKKMAAANVLGKSTTVLFYLAILLIVLQIEFAFTVLWIAIVVSLIASITYITEMKFINRKA